MSVTLYISHESGPPYYVVIQTGQPQDPMSLGHGDSIIGAVANLDATPWQSAQGVRTALQWACTECGAGAQSHYELASDEDHGIAACAAAPELAADSLRRAIADDDEDSATTAAADIAAAGISAEITTSDSEPEDLDDSGRLWVISTHALIVAGVTVAEWTRCVVSHWGGGTHDSRPCDWVTEEDATDGATLPDVVESVLEYLDLEDSLPTGADEPTRSTP